MKFLVSIQKTRLDKAVVEAQPDFSRSRVQRDIEEGRVKVNGQVVTEAKFVVRMDDEVVYTPEDDKKEVAKNIPLKVLYNNHGLLIIDKPPGLSVHPGSGFKGDSLTSALLYHFKGIKLVGEEGRPGIVHRLDKDTSGVMLIALTQEMYEYLKDAFQERKIKKEYIALVLGEIPQATGVIDTPIGKSKTDFRKYTAKNPLTPKQSLTEYKRLEVLDIPGTFDKTTLLSVKLHTGRTHQIRVHLSSLGHPLMGDTLYGSKKSQLSGLKRQFLHAKRIEVQLPDGTWIEAESELPPDLSDILEHLRSKR